MNTACNQQCFERQVSGYVDVLFKVALTLTHDARTAERLTRETLAEAFAHPAESRSPAHVKPWLLRLLRDTFTARYQQSGGSRDADADGWDDSEPELLHTLACAAVQL